MGFVQGNLQLRAADGGGLQMSTNNGLSWGSAAGGSISVATDPRTGGGQAASAGTIALLNDGLGLTAFVKDNTSSVNGWYLFPGSVVRQTLVANATTVTFSGLNGNLDGDYLLRGHILLPSSSTTTLSIQPNGVATNQEGQLTSSTNGAVAGANLTSVLLGGITTTGAGYADFECRITTLTGFNRRFSYKSLNSTAGAGITEVDATVLWKETVTNMTSLVINSSLASAILSGSSFVLQALGVHTAC